MKKIIVFLLTLLVSTTELQAQNKALEKALKKEFKAKQKELKQGNWKIYGSSRSADVVLLKHFDRLSTMGDDAVEVLGVASKFKSKNVGVQMAYNNAVVTYAQKAGSHVKGRVVSDISGDGTEGTSEFEHFYAAYEREVEKEIKGELEQSFTADDADIADADAGGSCSLFSLSNIRSYVFTWHRNPYGVLVSGDNRRRKNR
jgi:hypothetical protein